MRISTNITNGTNQIKPIKLMTNNVAIKVENLSKRYRIGQYVGSGASNCLRPWGLSSEEHKVIGDMVGEEE